jgi:hypothetical protein
MGQIETCNFFVAVITDKFLANSENYLRYCSDAESSNKPMYVIVRNDVNWDEFKRFAWRHIFFFDTEKEYDKAWEKIRTDIKFFKKVQAA